ncbi:MAG: hypothetical protein LUO96_03145 [Methanomicrobiales archaeon]|nr:hypothetical protein [Methanomicrobiales archaeon]
MPNPVKRITSAGKPGTQPGVPSPRAPLPAPKILSGEGDWERITPETRAKVWKKRFGFRSTGTCVCCHQSTIHREDFTCGQRRAYASGGGTDVSNLEPICARCKEKMGTRDLASCCRKIQEDLKVVKPMPVKTTVKKTVRKTTAKKPVAKTAAAKKTVKKTTAKKPVAKTVKKTTAKKPAAKKAKR